MTQAFSDAELACMAETAVSHMGDTGHVWVLHSGEPSGYNIPKASYTLQPETVCGFQFANKTFENLGETDVPNINAKVRLPKTAVAVVNSTSCFRLTGRFGSPLEMVCDFEVVGEPRLGPDSIWLDLAMVTDGRFADYS